MAQPSKQDLDTGLKNLTYGFYVVATRAYGEDLKTREKDWVSAGTVSWAMQSSFDPPMLTIAVQKDSDLNETIQKSQAFSLTVLGSNEKELIERFAKQTKVDYSDNKVNGVDYCEGVTGAPTLSCGITTIECTLADALTPDGDHMLFVGKIENIINVEGEPITERETRFEYAGATARS